MIYGRSHYKLAFLRVLGKREKMNNVKQICIVSSCILLESNAIFIFVITESQFCVRDRSCGNVLILVTLILFISSHTSPMTCYSFLTVHHNHQIHFMIGVNLMETASFHFQGLPCSLESTIEKIFFFRTC